MDHTGTLVMHCAVGSDPGLQRSLNEDSAYASAHLVAVADGMGGHAHGEVASALAIAAIGDLDAPAPQPDPLATLSQSIDDVAQRLADVTQTNPATKGMGTTLTAMIWDGTQFAVAHLGDTRAYRLRDGVMEQITHDHTLVQSLVDEGNLPAERAHEYPNQSMLVRALQSTGRPSEPDLFFTDGAAADRYLLCSDGLTDVVDDQAIEGVLSTVADREAVVRELIELATAAGGPDNITCIVADLADAPSSTDTTTAGAVTARTDDEPADENQSWLSRLLRS